MRRGDDTVNPVAVAGDNQQAAQPGHGGRAFHDRRVAGDTWQFAAPVPSGQQLSDGSSLELGDAGVGAALVVHPGQCRVVLHVLGNACRQVHLASGQDGSAFALSER